MTRPASVTDGETERAERGASSARRAYVLTGVIVGLAVTMVFTVTFLLRPRGGERSPGAVSVADFRAEAKAEDRPAPDFELPAVSGGGRVSLEDYRDRVVILNFWASWCAPCREEAPHLQELSERRGDRVQVLGVNYRDDRAAARAFEEEFGLTYPSAYDPSGQLAFRYGLFGVPTTFVIERGRIRWTFTGTVDARLLAEALDALETP